MCPEVAAEAAELAESYGEIAAALRRASDKELVTAEKLPLLRETRERDCEAAAGLGRLAEALAA